jgi:hypothetical protein
MRNKIVGIFICTLLIASGFGSATVLKQNNAEDVEENSTGNIDVGTANTYLSDAVILKEKQGGGILTLSSSGNTTFTYPYEAEPDGYASINPPNTQFCDANYGCNNETGMIGGSIDLCGLYANGIVYGNAEAYQVIDFHIGETKTLNIEADLTYFLYDKDFIFGLSSTNILGICDEIDVYSLEIEPLWGQDEFEDIMLILLGFIPGSIGLLITALSLITDAIEFWTPLGTLLSMEFADEKTISFNVTLEPGNHQIKIGISQFATCFEGVYYQESAFAGGVSKIIIDGIASPENPTVNGPGTGVQGESYEFSTVSNDPNNDDIQYGFDWNGDSIVDEWTGFHNSGETVSVTHTFSEGGNNEINVVARDTDLMVSEESSYIIYISPAPYKPTVWDPNPNDDYVGIGQYFWAQTTDYDEDMISYRFDFGDGEISDWSAFRYSGYACSSDEICGLHIYNDEDEYEVKAQAKDEYGNVGDWSDSYTITIEDPEDDDPPVFDTGFFCDWVDTDPSSPTYMNHSEPKYEFILGNTVYCYNEISNTKEGDVITWYWDDWGEPFPTLYTFSWIVPYDWSSVICWCYWTPLETGLYYVRVYGNGHPIYEGTDYCPIFEVIEPSALSANTGGPYSGKIDTSISLIGSASGGVPPYTFKWDLDDDGEFDDASGSTVTNSWDAPGEYTIRLKVIDENSVEATDDTIVTITNEDTKPNKPTKPSGSIGGKVGIEYTYTSVTTDLDGGQISYLFDWDDGNDSGWLGPFDSGDNVESSHIWSAIGSYDIKVKAKDTNGAESDWSDTLEVKIGPRLKSVPYIVRSLQKLIHHFPLLEKLLTLFPVFDNLLNIQ